ncbi:MAG: hypothetical protein FVQ79_03235 [Planctomycetes bacterium]|nr:hypothetical protein [Planctomycetota bacterium]
MIDSLSANTLYYYRMQFRETGQSWIPTAEYSFYTQRAQGSTFTFSLTSDSHIDIIIGDEATWTDTLNNVAADNPDFHIDLGDAYAIRGLNPGDVAEAEAVYEKQRGFYDITSRSAPLFQLLGNHAQVEGWHLLEPLADSLPVMSTNALKKYYLNPIPDDFYTGDTDTYPHLDGDQLRENYYAWTWGDALFVVLDPYWFTTTMPYTTNQGGGETDTTGSGDRWDWTLGLEQYNWLKQTIENSNAKFKFVFSHQMTGGSEDYSRGGANAAHFTEWGGYGEDGTTWEWDTKRPAIDGWGSQPIHQMMVANDVSAFFHGHDHWFAYEKLDGVVYQELPSASFVASASQGDYLTGDGYTIWADAARETGHIRVTVSPSQATVDYIATSDGSSDYTYTIDAATAPPTTPTSMTFDGGDCNDTFVGDVEIECSGSTDANEDIITYSIEAFMAGSAVTGDLESGTVQMAAQGGTSTVILHQTSFESENDATEGYVDDGYSDWDWGEDSPRTGSHGPHVDDADVDSTYTYNSTHDLTSYESCSISVWMKSDGSLENGEYVALDYASTGSNWNLSTGYSGPLALVGAAEDDNTYHEITLDIPDTTGYNAFKWRFRADINRANEDAWVDDITVSAQLVLTSDLEANTAWTEYANVYSDSPAVTEIEVQIEVDSYNPESSVLKANNDPDLELEIYNGSSWVSIGTFDLPGTYTGTGLDGTNHTFTLSTTNAAILTAWQNSSNQDIRIRGVNMDYSDETTIDEINYINVQVTVNGKSWSEIGTHTDGSSYLWDLSGIPNQTGVDLKCRAIDLAGTNTYSDYYDPAINLTIGSEVEQHTLTTSSSVGGSVTTPGEPGPYDYNSGTVASIAAVPDPNYHFVSWTGSGVTAGKVASPGSASTTITMDADYAVQANFVPIEHTLTITVVGNGSVDGPYAAGAQQVNQGTSVTIAGTPDADWQLDSITPNNFTMTGAQGVTMTFVPIEHTLTITLAGTGTGVIEAPYSAGAQQVNQGTTVIVVGTPDAGSSLVSIVPNNFTMSAPTGVTVTFTQDNYDATVTVVGTGCSVTNAPGNPYTYDQTATLTPVANVGWIFSGWSGADSGELVDAGGGNWTLVMDGGKDVTATFTIDTHVISGHLLEQDDTTAIAGILIETDDPTIPDVNDVTDPNGYYELTVAYGWSGIVEPNAVGYMFDPNETDRTLTNVTSDTVLDLTGYRQAFIISGTILEDDDVTPIEGVTVTPENGGGYYTKKYDPNEGSDVTDAGGYYEVLVDYDWSGKVTPTHNAYAFVDPNTSYSNVKADSANQDYAGTMLTFSISGYIENILDVPVEGVLVIAENGGGTDTTDVDGYYEVWVSYGWSDNVTTAREDYTFIPDDPAYVDVTTDITEDIIAQLDADIDGNGNVDVLDLRILCENWLMAGDLSTGNLDGSGFVDMLDISEIAEYWQK